MEKIFFFHKRCKVQIFLLLLFSVYSLILSHSAFGANLNLKATWTPNTESRHSRSIIFTGLMELGRRLMSL